MRTYVFLDLDDTIFQTRPKCPSGEPVSPAAYRRDGEPLSFSTERQQALFVLWSSVGTIIPTTARNRDAFLRVKLPFSSFAILDFGGVVLLPDGTPEPDWDAAIRPRARQAAARLEELCQSAIIFIRKRGLNVTARVIADFDLPLYLVMKQPGGNAGQLQVLADEHLPDTELDGFFIHHNDNNLSLVPRFLGKEKAVAYLLERHLGPEPVLTLGVGDSLSDAPFLALCDYALLPRRSQLAQHALSPLAFVGQAASLSVEGTDKLAACPTKNETCAPFSGSYPPDDVTFLLKPVELDSTPVEEKERLLQSGRRHYSEMITRERLPSPRYLRVFHEGLEREKTRFARDLIALALGIASARSGPITLVSLARAGTPIGVLLTRVLRRHFQREVAHYSISIIRDRGIDEVALGYILSRHPAASLVFLDGWTGKGVIALELMNAVAHFNDRHRVSLDPGLYAVADLCGAAKFAATADDYLIPTCVLGATISGLISRSILNDSVVGPGDFHGCLYYREFEADDLSRWFVERMSEEIDRQWNARPAFVGQVPNLPHKIDREELRRRSDVLLEDLQRRWDIRDVNHVKPGIGEATRVLLRRVPDRLLLRDAELPEVVHLLLLTREKNVPLTVEPSLPYLAVALIRELEG